MKILVLSNLYPPDVVGGYELGCRQAVDWLLDRGHDVRVVTSTPRTPIPIRPEPHVLRRFALDDVWYNASRERSNPAVNRVWEVDGLWFSSHNVHTLIQQVEEFRPDVAYPWMLLGVGGLGLMGALQYLGIPWVWHLMDRVPSMLCSSNWRVIPGMVRAYNRLLSGRYLACSRGLVERIERDGFELGDDVELIPNWVEGDRPRTRTTFYRPGSGPLRAISAGRITRDKGVDLLIEAVRLLRDRGVGPDAFRLDLYGPVFDRELPELAHRHGLADLVTFHGAIPQHELTRRFAESDLMVFPTEAREPFGFAPIEAAAQGCVPMISRICGVGEWLVDGVHCLKSARDAASFAAGIAGILAGEVDLAPIGRRAQAVVRRDFHRDALLPRVERSLKRAARAPRVAAGSAADAYRMAILAQRLGHAIVQEPFAA